MPNATAADILVRIDSEVMRHIETAQRPRESYNAALRRLLGLDSDGAQGRAEAPQRAGADGSVTT